MTGTSDGRRWVGRVLGPLLLVAAALGGVLWYENSGKTRTVTTPGVPDVGDRARGAGSAAVHGGDSWVQTHATAIGTVLAFVLCGALLWAIWTKLGKGWIVLLVIIALAVTGMLTVGH
jgi:hypothetical protein